MVETMLSKDLIKDFEKQIDDFWKEEIIHNDDFVDMLQRNEAGHGLANYIESTTIRQLKEIAKERYQIKNEINKRSMGDFWIQETNSDFYTPINIKTGIETGSPNIVSINKIIDSIYNREIDSYYLFIIKFKLQKSKWLVEICKILNLFDILDYISFNLGPLQLMLNESKLYKNIKNIDATSTYSLKDILKKIHEFYSSNLNQFIKNRQQKLEKYDKIIQTFDINKPID